MIAFVPESSGALAFDTYDREVERYGAGLQYLPHAESIYSAALIRRPFWMCFGIGGRSLRRRWFLRVCRDPVACLSDCGLSSVREARVHGNRGAERFRSAKDWGVRKSVRLVERTASIVIEISLAIAGADDYGAAFTQRSRANSPPENCGRFRNVPKA